MLTAVQSIFNSWDYIELSSIRVMPINIILGIDSICVAIVNRRTSLTVYVADEIVHCRDRTPC